MSNILPVVAAALDAKVDAKIEEEPEAADACPAEAARPRHKPTARSEATGGRWILANGQALSVRSMQFPNAQARG